MNLEQAEEWVGGVLSLASCGAAHEVERDEELMALGDLVEHAGIGERGDFVVTALDGARYRVIVRLLDPDTGNPV
jgi:hypothetical protein